MLKRLKNVENKTDNQLLAIENNQSGSKSIDYTIRDRLPEKAINVFDDLVEKDKTINNKRPYYRGGNNVDYDFSNFSSMGEPLKKFTMEKF